ncbi:MAG: NAD-dependent epimerase/dehydratase family protein, partial [Polyangiaceae bacterium]|nr:NAD-dependent epimerase/dehydratase family protein [Polyangiaceae bacterium]
MQRILMTGGTGLIGRPLADALRARGDEVTVVSRRTQPPAVGWGDIEREVGRADAVIHLAGEPIADRRWTDDHLARVRASRVDTAARIARAIQSASRKPRVLLCASGVSFYGMRDDDEVLDETAPPGDDSLARLVVDWENASAPAEVVGVRVVHARIG